MAAGEHVGKGVGMDLHAIHATEVGHVGVVAAELTDEYVFVFEQRVDVGVSVEQIGAEVVNYGVAVGIVFAEAIELQIRDKRAGVRMLRSSP